MAYYIIGLLFSIGGLAYADFRYKLVLFRLPKIYGQLLALSISFFLLWDAIGIMLQVFATNQKWIVGLHIISPDVPIEELLFLTLLSYVTLLTWRLACLRIS